jgi:transcriptional regulator with PAS, ATPase and Fis domain
VSETPRSLGAEAGATQVPSELPGARLRVRAVSLRVTAGPDAGRGVRVERPSFVIGTGPGADLRLGDPTVSREHLRLSLLPGGVQLRDPGSRNGTFIGPLRVADAVVREDATLTLGNTAIALHLEASPLELPLSAETQFGGAIGVSEASRHLFALLERAAKSDVTVLLEGESGVGKGIFARGLHARSRRARGPFVAVDCGAIPATLIESELFGHERGAFTGAVDRRPGVFQQAHGGTLFLDEVGELPLPLQPKLLRVLEEREVRPLGATAPMSVDVRVVAATNRALDEAARVGEFRKDLFYRLAVARVLVPPLRDRMADIPPIALHFLREATGDPNATLPPDLAGLLTSYAWPGNVRELRNVIHRHAFLGTTDLGRLFDPPVTGGAPAEDLSELPYHEARRRALERFERGYFSKVLARADGVITRAAELAGVARPSFYRMLARLRVPGAVGDDEGDEAPPAGRRGGGGA